MAMRLERNRAAEMRLVLESGAPKEAKVDRVLLNEVSRARRCSRPGCAPIGRGGASGLNVARRHACLVATSQSSSFVASTSWSRFDGLGIRGGTSA
jgi:hypothetical protein